MENPTMWITLSSIILSFPGCAQSHRTGSGDEEAKTEGGREVPGWSAVTAPSHKMTSISQAINQSINHLPEGWNAVTPTILLTHQFKCGTREHRRKQL